MTTGHRVQFSDFAVSQVLSNSVHVDMESVADHGSSNGREPHLDLPGLDHEDAPELRSSFRNK